MPAKPTLIIQMQRMGDLILTFSLCQNLRKIEPDHPVWVVGEPAFFSGLLSLAPHVTFFSPYMSSQLRQVEYYRVINLSHRDEAINLAGSLHTEKRIGAFRRNGILYIEGEWRLYRSSLIGNNRHNRFHWSDMEALGVIPAEYLPQTLFPTPDREILKSPWKRGLVGIFVGASERAKRPDASFWGNLIRLLLRRGLRPCLLGGPDDREMANEVTRLSDLPKGANFAGHFKLADLASFMQKLDLLITPDTGPMHLAAWVGAPILNLSMGPVNAWETAPASPGHLVLRPTISCVGCWRCPTPICRHAFSPGDIGAFIIALAQGRGIRQHRPHGLALFQTERDDRGLFSLKEISCGNPLHPQRAHLAAFWQECFLQWLGGAPNHLSKATENLFTSSPQILKPLHRSVACLTSGLANGLRHKVLPNDFWQNIAPILRPLSSYILCLLQNGDFSTTAWSQGLELAEKFVKIIEKI